MKLRFICTGLNSKAVCNVEHFVVICLISSQRVHTTANLNTVCIFEALTIIVSTLHTHRRTSNEEQEV